MNYSLKLTRRRSLQDSPVSNYFRVGGITIVESPSCRKVVESTKWDTSGVYKKASLQSQGAQLLRVQ